MHAGCQWRDTLLIFTKRLQRSTMPTRASTVLKTDVENGRDPVIPISLPLKFQWRKSRRDKRPDSPRQNRRPSPPSGTSIRRVHAELEYLAIRGGSRGRRSGMSVCWRARPEMLKARRATANRRGCSPGDSPDAPTLGTTLDHQHDEVRTKPETPHGLRATFVTAHHVDAPRGSRSRCVYDHEDCRTQ